jgi:hypothetical protein
VLLGVEESNSGCSFIRQGRGVVQWSDETTFLVIVRCMQMDGGM